VAWYEKNIPDGIPLAPNWLRVPGEQNHGLAAGASLKDIETFEKAIGAKLPNDFRESLLMYNGGVDCDIPFRSGDLLSLDVMLSR